MRPANLERQHPADSSGVQLLYRFDNNYGASVVRNAFSYGHEDGLWELAVVRYVGPDLIPFLLCYSTPITDDVLGYCTEEEIDETLAQIEALPPSTQDGQ